MPAGLQRYYGKGHLHFITFSCYWRLPLLKTARARDIFLKELGKVRDEMGFHLLGYVVMPEHVHLLTSEPPQGTPSTVLQKLKPRVARKLRKPECGGQMRLPFAETREPLRAFWQARFYDFNGYSEGKKKGKTQLHARESGDSRTGETSERLAVEQLGILSERRGWVGGDRCGGVRGSNPKTQVQTTNLGHPPRGFDV
jgi:putative transposase